MQGLKMLALLLVSPLLAQAVSLRAEHQAMAHAKAAGALIGESKAALAFLQETLEAATAPAAPAAQKAAPAAQKAAPAAQKAAPAAQKAAPAAQKKKVDPKDVIDKLTVELKKLEQNSAGLKKLSVKNKESEEAAKRLRKGLSAKDAKMMDEMDKWSDRSNEKARLHATAVESKLKNAIHLIKKGALSGDKDAAANLNNLMKKMAGMIG
eukprot:TRINITY_DN29127_c0_g1_i1.p1 TRINITY_DN29127_c0_g1~~TRINITY_DN29127_c0_g1_i1.p1  ORF type:complete len:209 (+),score=96.80 TRINITY_DN29127_c0_g1_i1:115-741(+)